MCWFFLYICPKWKIVGDFFMFDLLPFYLHNYGKFWIIMILLKWYLFFATVP